MWEGANQIVAFIGHALCYILAPLQGYMQALKGRHNLAQGMALRLKIIYKRQLGLHPCGIKRICNGRSSMTNPHL
jgi:hypothetical protein